MSGSPESKSWTYGEYLQLSKLLTLQGDERDISNDEMHFIVVHQTFELWFKQIIRELREVRDILNRENVPENHIPKAVDHLTRTTEIFRLMANQWSVLETLTPQGFLSFRDDLGTASGFESYQMREFEILLGLKNEDRLGGMDPLKGFERAAKENSESAQIYDHLKMATEEKSLFESLMNWIGRTPIMGSKFGSEHDSSEVAKYVEEHLEAHKQHGESLYGNSISEKISTRLENANKSARDFLIPEEINRPRVGLLFIESYRELPLLTWPRKLIDGFVELEESIVKWRHSHARMVERIMGRRIGTGGTSGVDYLDATSQYRIFKDLWGVRTILIKPQDRPALRNAEFYGYSSK
jgi:tryptophan 2,3-dioxygenase